jgi:amidase
MERTRRNELLRLPNLTLTHKRGSDAFYTTLCNVLDYPSSVIPVTHVDPELDAPAQPHKFYNYEDEAVYNLCKSLSGNHLAQKNN